MRAFRSSLRPESLTQDSPAKARLAAGWRAGWLLLLLASAGSLAAEPVIAPSGAHAGADVAAGGADPADAQPAPIRPGDPYPVYAPRLDEAEWHVDASPFHCRLTQPVPDFGAAVFETRAGLRLAFHFDSRSNPFAAGTTRLVAAAPQWDPTRATVDLGPAETLQQARPLTLAAPQAQRLLDSLYSGMAPIVRQHAWYADRRAVAVGLSSAGFRAAYRQYQQCLAQLLPVNFEQIARSRIRFPTDQWQLDADARRQLDLIILYTQADHAVTELFVDGHTDNVGRRLYNLDLSRKRAEAVARYLAANGVAENRIVTRYHGERYPVAANAQAAGRSENRRVTIRLERGDA